MLRGGVTWTAVLMVLPGLLSSRPVENALLGLAVGLSATLVAAFGLYTWVSYVVPYRRIRSMVEPDLRGAAVTELFAVRVGPARASSAPAGDDWRPAA